MTAGHQLVCILILLTVELPAEPASLPRAVQSVQIETHVGQSVTLPCHPSHSEPVVWSFQRKDTVDVTFLFQGNRFINGHSTRFKLANYSLVVLDPQKDDSGLYGCIERDGLGDKHHTSLEVTDLISEIPLYVSFAGQEMRLPCRSADPAMKIQWRFHISSLHGDSNTILIISKNDSVTPKFSDRFALDKFITGDHNLVIKNTRVNDSGEYKCVGNKGATSASISSVRLMVTEPERTAVATLGSEVSLGCNIYSPSSVSWIFAKNDSISAIGVSPSFQTLMSHDGRISVMHIDRVDFAHAGKYSCTTERGLADARELVAYEAVLSCNVSSSRDEFGNIVTITCHMRYEGNVHPSVSCHVGNTEKSINLSRDTAEGSFKANMSPTCDMDTKTPLVCTAVFNANSNMAVVGQAIDMSSLHSSCNVVEVNADSVDYTVGTFVIVLFTAIFIVGVVIVLLTSKCRSRCSLLNLATKKRKHQASASQQNNNETSVGLPLLEIGQHEEKEQLESLGIELETTKKQLIDAMAANVKLNEELEKLKVEVERSPTQQQQPTHPDEDMPVFELTKETETGGQIRGVCVMGDRLFVARDGQSDIDVYDKQTMERVDRLPVTGEGSEAPCCMESDNPEHSLYITYYIAKIVRRVQVADKSCKEWEKLSSEPDGVAVLPPHNVLVVLRNTRELVEFEPNGRLIRTITLESTVELPRYAMPLGSDRFLVCYGYHGKSECGTCLVNFDGKVEKTVDSQTQHPLHLTAGPHGSVLVAGFGDNKVTMLDGNLQFMLDTNCGVNRPFRVCYDDQSKQLFVGQYLDPYRVFSFNVKRGSVGR